VHAAQVVDHEQVAALPRSRHRVTPEYGVDVVERLGLAPSVHEVKRGVNARTPGASVSVATSV